MVDVKGRLALITGASRGIGYGAALFMAGKGCNLILQGRTEEHLSKVVKEAQALGVQAVPMACELSDRASVEDMLKRIDALGMQVDIVLISDVIHRTEYQSGIVLIRHFVLLSYNQYRTDDQKQQKG